MASTVYETDNCVAVRVSKTRGLKLPNIYNPAKSLVPSFILISRVNLSVAELGFYISSSLGNTLPKRFALHNRLLKCITINLLVVDAVSGDDEDKTKSIDGKACPGNRSGIQLIICENCCVPCLVQWCASSPFCVVAIFPTLPCFRPALGRVRLGIFRNKNVFRLFCSWEQNSRNGILVFRNENSSQTNAYLHYSNYSYFGLIPNERALNSRAVTRDGKVIPRKTVFPATRGRHW